MQQDFFAIKKNYKIWNNKNNSVMVCYTESVSHTALHVRTLILNVRP